MSSGEISQSAYATRRKDLLAVIDQLRANGSQDELDLPKIAVIGNQSAGKSSIVEAISGISVPRDGGTCTRCAFECRLSPAAEWSCIIKIRREFDASGARLAVVREVPFGPVIKEKEEVEARLRRAQIAVLIGDDDAALGLTALEVKHFQEELSASSQDQEEESVLQNIPRFSQNTVCILLQGPDYTDLAFMDLPGLIAAEDRETVQLVEDIVLSRIQGNCLILLTLPMSDDMMNQKALQLARRVDPKGRRTIGVLTKPDMLTSGSLDAHAFWVKVLAGAGPYQLDRGYFCSKQPDDKQRRSGITSAEARKAEREFFAKVEPWSKFADKRSSSGVSLRDCLGLPLLVAKLSDSLTEIIDSSLPQLYRSAEKLSKHSQEELAKLPKAPGAEPFADVLQMITLFCEDLAIIVQSSTAHTLRQWSDAASHLNSQNPATSLSSSNKLVHQNRAAFSRYREHIHRTRPRFQPYSKKDRRRRNVKDVDGFLRDEEDPQDQGMPDGMVQEEMDLDDVRDYIASSTTRELPGNVPYAAKVALITSVQASWPTSTHTCADAVRNSLLESLRECAEQRFKCFPVLHRMVISAYVDLVEKRFDSCLVTLQDILETEQSPFTQNRHYLESSTDTWLSRYKEARARVHSLPAISDSFATPSFPSAPVNFNFAEKPQPNSSPFAFGANSQTQASAAPFAGSFGAPVGTPVAQHRTPKAQNTSRAEQAFWPASAFSAPGKGPSVSVTPPRPNAASAQTTSESESREEKYNNLFKALADLGYRNLTEEDLARLNPPDEYESEMKVMAEVRGYFKVSFKRVIDIIPSLIDLKFIRAVAKDMQTHLVEELALGSNDARERCMKYLQQDPTVEVRRNELQAVIKRMHNAQVELRRLGA